MSKSKRIRSEDVRRLLRLMREADELSDDWRERARHIAEGLCGIVHARVGIMAFIRGRMEPEIIEAADWGWDNDEERSAFAAYLEDDHSSDPLLRPVLEHTEGLATYARQQMLDDRDWYGSAHFNERLRTARVNHCIYSIRRNAAPGLSFGMGLHRGLGEKPFTEREVELTDLFHAEAAWVLKATGDRRRERMLTDVPPRRRQVLRRLLAGDSEKQVAERLGVSRHTVHDHVKALHEQFGVRSRGELLALWMRKGPGEQNVEETG